MTRAVAKAGSTKKRGVIVYRVTDWPLGTLLIELAKLSAAEVQLGCWDMAQSNSRASKLFTRIAEGPIDDSVSERLMQSVQLLTHQLGLAYTWALTADGKSP